MRGFFRILNFFIGWAPMLVDFAQEGESRLCLCINTVPKLKAKGISCGKEKIDIYIHETPGGLMTES